jgi:hypothetical protein
MNLLGYFIGRISRVDFVNIFDGFSLPGIPLTRLETEMIQLYSNFFANKYQKEIIQMRTLMYKDF